MYRSIHVCVRLPVYLHVDPYMGWLRLVGSLELQVSFAKEPYKRDYVLQKRPIILRRLFIVATPYLLVPIYLLVGVAAPYICSKLQVRIPFCLPVCLSVCMYICVHVCMRICVCAHVRVYVYESPQASCQLVLSACGYSRSFSAKEPCN